MHKGASQAHNEGLENVAFIRTRIELIESFFPPNEVDEIWLTFPDPQMKRARRRLTATRFLNSYLNILKPGGIVHLKTDSNFQYTYTQAMAEVNGLTVLNNFSDLYHSGFVDDILSIQTYYESRFMEHNIPIKYFSYIRRVVRVKVNLHIVTNNHRASATNSLQPETTFYPALNIQSIFYANNIGIACIFNY